MAKLSKAILLCLLGAVLALCTAVGLICLQPNAVTARAAESDHAGHTPGWTELTAGTTALAGGYYYLNDDIKTSGVIDITGTVTLCLNGHKLTGGSVNGSVIRVYGNLTLCDCNGSNGSHDYYVDSNGLYVFNNGQAGWQTSYNAATQKGTVQGGVITGGYHPTGGGGVSVAAANAHFVMNGGTIAGNTSGQNGGGVYVLSGSAEINEGAIIGNRLTYAGGYNSYGAGIMVYNDSRLTINGGMIANNVGNPASGEDSTYGGGVAVMNAGSLVMTGGEIKNNSAAVAGGVYIESDSSVVSFSGSPVIAENQDSNLYIQSGQTVTVAGAFTSGAHIGVTLEDVASTFTTGYSTYHNSSMVPAMYFFSDNESYAVQFDSNETINEREVILGDVISTVEFEGDITPFSNIHEAFVYACTMGTSADDQAAVILQNNCTTDRALSVAVGDYITLDLNGYMLQMTGNDTVISVSGSFMLVDSYSGTERAHCYTVNESTGRYDFSATQSDTYISGGVITGGTYEYSGGGISVYGGTFTMNGGTIAGNSAGDAGGGVYVCDSTFIMSGGKILGNTAVDGAGVYMTDSSFIMNDGAISNNVANYGGGVEGWSSDIEITGGEISGNHASETGGGIYFSRNSDDSNNYTLTISGNGSISNNVAGDSGGGIYVNTVSLAMTGGTIAGNTADNGAGVYVQQSAAFALNGGLIEKNNANNNGAGVYVLGSFAMNGGEISGNIAAGTTNGGGGVYVFGGTFTMEGGAVKMNRAQNGAGVYVQQAAFTLNDGSIEKNNASNNGGGVFLFSNNISVLQMNGGEIVGNGAAQGGGVYMASGSILSIIGGYIIDNNATVNGGGVYVWNNGTVNMSGAPVISDNTVESKANNVYIYVSNLPNGNKINIIGELLSGAKVGISRGSMQGNQFTAGYSTYNSVNPSAYFFSDDSAFRVDFNSGGNNEAAVRNGVYTLNYLNSNGFVITSVECNVGSALTLQTFESLNIAQSGIIGWALYPSGNSIVYDDGATIAGGLGSYHGEAVNLYAVTEDYYQTQIDGINTALTEATKALEALYAEGNVPTDLELSNALGELVTQLKAAQSAVGSLEEVVGDADSGLVQAVNELKKTMNDAENGILARLSVLEQATADLNSEIESAIKAVLENAGDTATLADAMAELSKLIGEANGKIDTLNGVIAALGDAYATDSELTTAVETLNGTISTAKGELQRQIDSLQDQLEEALSDIEGNTGDIAANAEAIQDLINGLAAAEEAIEALDAGTVTDQELADAVAALEEAIRKAQSSLQAAIGGVQSDLDAAVRELRAAIEANAADAAEKLAALEEAYKAADAVLSGDITTLQAADETLRGSIAALESAYKAADEAIWDAIEQLRGDVDANTAALNTAVTVLWVVAAVAVVALGIGVTGLVLAIKNKKN